MSNQLGTKPARVVSVALQEVDAIRLHAHRKEYKHPMPVIVMAGVTALEEGANPEYSWFDRLMGATCSTHDLQRDLFVIEFFGGTINAYKGEAFKHSSVFDSCKVSNSEETIYAGTRPNCEAVARHLNKIMREAEKGL